MHKLFKNKGFINAGIHSLTPREAYDLCQQGAIIVDVREEYMNRHKMFDVEETIFCPKSILEESINEIPKDKALIFADAAGLRSKEAVVFLIENGFENISNMAGGLVEWERDQLPLRTDKSERLTGSCMCMLRKREKKDTI